MSKINIAFGVTEDWLKYTYVTMCSVLMNSQKEDKYKFFILSDLSDSNFQSNFKNYLEKLHLIRPFEHEYIKMNNSDFDGIVHDKRVGISAYYRLKLASLTTEDKIIYLDSDIVVTDDISKLWHNYDIEKYLIGAVEDKYSSLMGCKANLNDDDIYYNSGVLIMNLKNFRNNNIENLIFNKLREPNNLYSDQDVLNDICRGQILDLPLKYNLVLSADDVNTFPTRKKEFEASLNNPVILHYTIKPWLIPVQYSEYWRKYADYLKI